MTTLLNIMFNYTDSRSIYNTIVKILQTWLTLSHTLSWAPVGRRAKHGQIQGGGCRGPAKIRQSGGGGCNIFFYFLLFKNITF